MQCTALLSNHTLRSLTMTQGTSRARNHHDEKATVQCCNTGLASTDLLCPRLQEEVKLLLNRCLVVRCRTN
jgi:hypothetical protein